MHKISLFLLSLSCSSLYAGNDIVVYQSDFGLKDGAVSAMKGVAAGVSPKLKLYDLTHEIPAYNIWDAAYRLHQTVSYWPKDSVFVSVVDPGVGTERLSVVAQTKDDHWIVTPNNGTLTLLADTVGIKALRQIDESKNRLKGSEKSYTFHGRDVYSYTAAKLASNAIKFEEVGPELSLDKIVKLPYQKAELKGQSIWGVIEAHDVQYGNIWTNISDDLLKKLDLKTGDSLTVSISEKGKKVYSQDIPYVNSFGDVPNAAPLCYLNSLLNLSLALNMGNFAQKFLIGYGADWRIEIRKAEKVRK